MNEISNLIADRLPKSKGVVMKSYKLAPISWLKVGGPAEFFFKPNDFHDLQHFLTNLDRSIPVFFIGACSNLLIRDGGIPGVCIKLGKNFGKIEFGNDTITVGASMPAPKVAILASNKGLDLTFLRTIPGTVGGVVKMNAGCYGRYVSDYLESVNVIERNGRISKLTKEDLKFNYRSSSLQSNCVVTSATFRSDKKAPEVLKSEMDEAVNYRASIQPTSELSCGSAFKNPSGFSSTGKNDKDTKYSAWKLIDDAGLRGITLGKAKVSEKHPNFLINMGGASASDLEDLGEKIRKTVLNLYGVQLDWEIKVVGKR